MSTNSSTTREESDIEHQMLRDFAFACSEPSLLRPEQLAKRLSLLDELDAMVGNLVLEVRTTCPDSGIISCANTIKTRLEAANENLYESARSEIILEGKSHTLHQWLLKPATNGQEGSLSAGLGFDLRDEIVSGVLQFPEPAEPDIPLSPEMVPYQPTPARHTLDLIAASKLSDDDILVDLGSGLGHVPLLVSILTGNRSVGVEFQPAYVASAQESAQNLNLHRVRFVAEDARVTDLSSGTVFYLFSPFTGSIMTDVLCRLRKESTDRQIRICSLGPCTRALEDEAWLKSSAPPDTGRIAVFKSQ